MRRWGILITACYAVVVVFLLVPGAAVIAGGEYAEAISVLFGGEGFVEAGWIAWILIALIVAAQAVLFFVSVDTRFRHARPRAHVTLSIATIAFATALLTLALYITVAVTFDFEAPFEDSPFWFAVPILLWCFWGGIFFAYRYQISHRLDRAVDWLLAGSVLQLLVAVPCHLIVRHRNECSAPGVTGLGIATGIALMLMAFGPSVYFLYRKRLGEYAVDSDVPRAAGRRRTIVVSTLTLTVLTLFLLLPYDDTATHRIFIDRLPASADEVTAAVDRYASEHGFRIDNVRAAFQILYCDDGIVASFRVFERRDGSSSWTVLTYSEPFLFTDNYEEFAESIRELTAPFGDSELEYVDDRPLQDKIRSNLYEGPLFGHGCDWNARRPTEGRPVSP